MYSLKTLMMVLIRKLTHNGKLNISRSCSLKINTRLCAWMMKMYKITGVDRNGKRFKIETNSRMHAFGINLWKGSVWKQKQDGGWKLLHRVYC